MRNLYSIILQGFLLVLSAQTLHGAEEWIIPRTEFDQPDMQGVWYYGSGTDFERPVNLGTQQLYTEAQAMAIQESLQAMDAAKTQIRDPNRGAPAAGVPIEQEADHEFATTRVNLVQIDGEYRTSQIVSPADDRLVLQCQHADHSD